jgi:hypothetical protein
MESMEKRPRRRRSFTPEFKAEIVEPAPAWGALRAWLPQHDSGHPKRGFTGREQVRRNWEQIFAAIPYLNSEILCSAVDGNTVWTEWEHRGTRPDDSRHLMRGVVIFGMADGLADWARFCLEPVREGDGDADAAVRTQVGSGGQP